ncbi:hypothetical protein KIN20_018738 [Parelaphostrongylus tenuis]|uniref:Uncharacterized protein n=1 Tax=Parelaphostrongylus tenuis TaxID=148309 RepID=A0AAD5MK09_PARTN|nr:hypothetical protein KIN20_018738 [Parelaphostrongylus tenuis]
MPFCLVNMIQAVKPGVLRHSSHRSDTELSFSRRTERKAAMSNKLAPLALELINAKKKTTISSQKRCAQRSLKESLRDDEESQKHVIQSFYIEGGSECIRKS